MPPESLGEFELLVMLAAVRLVGEEPELARPQVVHTPWVVADGPSVAVSRDRSAACDHFSVGAWPTLAFTFGFAITTGVLFGVSPALHATRLSVSDVLKDAASGVSRSRMSLQRGLIVGQIALTQPLLVGLASLILALIAGMNYSTASPLSERIVTVAFSNLGESDDVVEYRRPTGANLERWGRDRALIDAELERIRAGFEAGPGVLAAIPRVDYKIGMGPQHRIQPADRVRAAWDDTPFRLIGEPIAPGYLRLMGIPLLRGRDFDPLDPARDSSAILIGADLARRLWGEADPIGRRLVSEDGTPNVHVAGVFDDRPAGPSDLGDGYRVFRPLLVRVPSRCIQHPTSNRRTRRGHDPGPARRGGFDRTKPPRSPMSGSSLRNWPAGGARF